MRNRSVLFSLVLTILLLGMCGTVAGQVRVGVAIGVAPPPIPVYEQPICPGDGYIWTPGYWAYDYDDADYYWVPGTWVPTPEVGFLWTPGYWAWGGDGFVFTAGYWGPIVGFYGGINYGFGYFGHGYEGGRWDGGHFYYNTTVNRVNVEVVHNVYSTRVTETTVTRVSYNGGNGGIAERPRPEEQAAAQQRHIAAVSSQVQHEQVARSDKQQRASINHGAPAVAATPKPGAFKESGVVRTREAGGPYNPAPPTNNPTSRTSPANNPGNNNTSKPVVHPNDLPRVDHAAQPNTGNPKQDLKIQQEQEKLQGKQQKDMQKLQQKQEQEHQQMAQQQANQAKQQQMEQRHQQQTQQLQQKHEQQAQQLHEKRQPPPPPAHPGENKPPH